MLSLAYLQSSFLTNFLPVEPLKQLGDLTNAPCMILFSLIVVAISQTYTLLKHTHWPHQAYVSALCAVQCELRLTIII